MTSRLLDLVEGRLFLWGDFRLEHIAVERFAEPPKCPSPVELRPGAGAFGPKDEKQEV